MERDLNEVCSKCAVYLLEMREWIKSHLAGLELYEGETDMIVNEVGFDFSDGKTGID